MSANSTTLTDGTYTASASSVHHIFDAFQAFDGDLSGVGWHSAGSNYTATGTYTGSASLGGVAGEWIALQLPGQMKLEGGHITIAPRAGYLPRTPRDFSILASNDGSTWTTLASVATVDQATYDGYVNTTLPVFRMDDISLFTRIIGAFGYTYNASAVAEYYTRYAIVIQKTNGGDNVQITDLAFYGTVAITLGSLRNHTHNIADVPSQTGQFALARIPTLSAATGISGTLSIDRMPNIDTSKLSAGSLNYHAWPAFDASRFTTGTIPTSAIRAAVVGIERFDVGTYCLAMITNGRNGVGAAATIGGAWLHRSLFQHDHNGTSNWLRITNLTLAGTWRNMGHWNVNDSNPQMSIFLRIS